MNNKKAKDAASGKVAEWTMTGNEMALDERAIRAAMAKARAARKKKKAIEKEKAEKKAAKARERERKAKEKDMADTIARERKRADTIAREKDRADAEGRRRLRECSRCAHWRKQDGFCLVYNLSVIAGEIVGCFSFSEKN